MKEGKLMKTISRWFRYRALKTLVKFRKAKVEEIELNEIQKRVFNIVSMVIYDNRSELMINPTIDTKVGEKYYIKKSNKDGDIEKFITITRNSEGYNVALIGHELINGSNYNYHFDVSFNDISGQLLVKKFIRVIKQRRDRMEWKIRKDDEKILDLIFSKN